MTVATTTEHACGTLGAHTSDPGDASTSPGLAEHAEVPDMADDSRSDRDLYRFYDAEGRLLYIGISLNAASRAATHSKEKSWWGKVATMSVQRLGACTRREAEAIERQAIEDEGPICNVVHNQRSGSLSVVWRCVMCGQPINHGTGGYIAVTHAQIELAYRGVLVEWRVVHRHCDDLASVSSYRIPTDELTTEAEVLQQTAILMLSPWIALSNWDIMIWNVANGGNIVPERS